MSSWRAKAATCWLPDTATPLSLAKFLGRRLGGGFKFIVLQHLHPKMAAVILFFIHNQWIRIVGVHGRLQQYSELSYVVGASNSQCFSLNLRNCCQQKCRENAHKGEDDEQL